MARNSLFCFVAFPFPFPFPFEEEEGEQAVLFCELPCLPDHCGPQDFSF
jgi:hypothetical protein